MAMMAALEEEITAYEAMQRDLESQHMGKWVLVHDRVLIGVHDSFEGVAEDAVRRFGRGPYLIRQIGDPPFVMPASVMYAPVHGKH
jgi:hypothetical protein